MKQNRQHVHHSGFSTVKRTTGNYTDVAGQNRTYRRKWSEVVSGNPKQHPADRTPAEDSLHNPAITCGIIQHEYHPYCSQRLDFDK